MTAFSGHGFGVYFAKATPTRRRRRVTPSTPSRSAVRIHFGSHGQSEHHAPRLIGHVPPPLAANLKPQAEVAYRLGARMLATEPDCIHIGEP